VDSNEDGEEHEWILMDSDELAKTLWMDSDERKWIGLDMDTDYGLGWTLWIQKNSMDTNQMKPLKNRENIICPRQ